MAGTGELPKIFIDDLAEDAEPVAFGAVEPCPHCRAKTGERLATGSELISQIAAARRPAEGESEDPALRLRVRDWSAGILAVARAFARVLAALLVVFVLLGRVARRAAPALTAVAAAHPIPALFTGAAIAGTAVGATLGAASGPPHAVHRPAVAPAPMLPSPPSGTTTPRRLGTHRAPRVAVITRPAPSTSAVARPRIAISRKSLDFSSTATAAGDAATRESATVGGVEAPARTGMRFGAQRPPLSPPSPPRHGDTTPPTSVVPSQATSSAPPSVSVPPSATQVQAAQTQAAQTQSP